MDDVSQPHIVKGFPVSVVELPGRGRGLVATRDLGAGELVLRSERMGFAIRQRQEGLWCCICLMHRLSEWSPNFPPFCPDCESVFLCPSCEKSQGAAFGESHKLICRAMQFAKNEKKLKTEERKMLRLILSILLDHAREHSLRLASPSLPASSCPCSLCLLRGKGEAPPPGVLGGHMCSLRDFVAMEEERVDAKGRVDKTRLATWVVQHAHPDLLAPLVGDIAAGEGDLVALIASLQLRDRRNVFNLANCDGTESGEVHFPAAAMMNHSCVPNVEPKFEGGALVVRTLHPVVAGTELCHVYVPLTPPTMDPIDALDPLELDASRAKSIISIGEEVRRLSLLNTWGFSCKCPRCQGECETEMERYDSSFVCTCGGVSSEPTKEGESAGDIQGLPPGLGEGLLCRCNVHNLQVDVLWPALH